jgi:hypothetical protein
LHFVFLAQPPTEPLDRISINRLIGWTDLAQSKIVGSPFQLLVQPTHDHFGLQPCHLACRHVSDTRHHTLDAFLRGPGAKIGLAGVAYGDVSAQGSQISGGLFSGCATQTKVGWTIGGGVEYALNQNLSLKAEYLYIDFGGVAGAAYGFAPSPVPPFIGSFSTGNFTANVTRIGLNWRFGGQAAAPVVAKY